ncbi:hypothetical protein T492DRAFT_840515 [Pavlovales sp. CCMP2436]|nr:hypothetical protein T492DRAFT_840515 [Pavlovales sp. CCMP2436]
MFPAAQRRRHHRHRGHDRRRGQVPARPRAGPRAPPTAALKAALMAPEDATLRTPEDTTQAPEDEEYDLAFLAILDSVIPPDDQSSTTSLEAMYGGTGHHDLTPDQPHTPRPLPAPKSRMELLVRAVQYNELMKALEPDVPGMQALEPDTHPAPLAKKRGMKLSTRSSVVPTRPSKKHCTRQADGKLPSQIKDARETLEKHHDQKHTWWTTPANPHLYACDHCGAKGMHTQAEADYHLAQHVHVHLNAK